MIFCGHIAILRLFTSPRLNAARSSIGADPHCSGLTGPFVSVTPPILNFLLFQTISSWLVSKTTERVLKSWQGADEFSVKTMNSQECHNGQSWKVWQKSVKASGGGDISLVQCIRYNLLAQYLLLSVTPPPSLKCYPPLTCRHPWMSPPLTCYPPSDLWDQPTPAMNATPVHGGSEVLGLFGQSPVTTLRIGKICLLWKHEKDRK